MLLALLHTACAPLGVGPPPTPLGASTPLEIGVALTGSGVLPASDGLGCEALLGCDGASAQGWARRALLDGRAELGVVAFAGNTSFFGGGAYGRLWTLDDERFRLGVELQLGFFWAAVALPAAVRVAPNLWLWTSPSGGARYFSVLRLPVGATWTPRESLAVSAELGVGWDPWQSFMPPETATLQGSLSVAYRWGADPPPSGLD